MSAVICRIQQVQPLVNGFIGGRFEAALEEARRADEEIKNCENIQELARSKPFLGVPFTAKDSVAINGIPQNDNTLWFNEYSFTQIILLNSPGRLV